VTYECEAALYLFMPDHIHVILEGKSDVADVRQCMADFKQRSGFALSRDTHGAVRWQKDFYDRVHRDDKEYRRKLNYILMNPVRAGLAESWRSYPYWGSTVYSKDQLLMGAKY
jgi:putative transposase